MTAGSRGGLGILVLAALLLVVVVDTVPPKYRWFVLTLLSVTVAGAVFALSF